jgi:hypothetical protein
LKILIITPYHMNPPAPRIIKEIEILEKNNINVKLLHSLQEQNFITRNFYLKKQIKKLNINSYDRILIFDLLTLIFLYKLLPKEKIIYEVLDSFPEYYCYKICKRNKFLYDFCKNILNKMEQFYCAKVNNIIVNSYILSKRLKQYNKNTYFIPYTSSFENLEVKNNPNNPEAFIYIGLFSKEKGAKDIIEFAKKYSSKKIFIIGDIKYKFDTNKFQNVFIYKRMNINDLTKKLKELIKQYFLFGFSLITTENESYAIQEANKDIDYLSLNIPIIGNKRLATYEKIKKGAGILINNFDLNISYEQKVDFIKNCQNIYNKFYSNEIFEERIIEVVSK